MYIKSPVNFRIYFNKKFWGFYAMLLCISYLKKLTFVKLILVESPNTYTSLKETAVKMQVAK